MKETGLGILAVAKTPMEFTAETEENLGYFPVVLDADGNLIHLQILQEETFLSKTFGAEYNVYKNKVRRYLGRK